MGTALTVRATVSGSNFASVLTDDPNVVGATDKTATQIDLYGTTTTVIGPSGSGKTTLLRNIITQDLARRVGPSGDRQKIPMVLCSILPQNPEHVKWAFSTLPPAGFEVATRAADVRESISLTGQFASVDNDLTADENLVMLGQLLGMTRAQAARSEADARAQSVREMVRAIVLYDETHGGHHGVHEIGVFEDRSTGGTIVVCALDNLGKGAAGQAVQNVNLLFGFAETTGLRLSGVLV